MQNNDKTGPLFWDVGVALALLTRLPLPRLPERAFAHQARAAWAFPLAGLAIGAPAAGLAWAALSLGLSATVTAGLVLAVQIILTGAMHEDGLADTADGLWGGFTPERRLEIMKDSRIGVYGVLALILSVGLRWSALTVLLDANAIWTIPAVAVLSRTTFPILMAFMPFARAEGLSRSVGAPGAATALVGTGLGCVLALVFGGVSLIPAAALAVAAVGALALIARAKIGGQTGDILGAAQQVAEIALLLTLSVT